MLDRVMGWHGLGRYTLGARLYDVLSLERPVYRVGRLAGIDLPRVAVGRRPRSHDLGPDRRRR